MKYASTNDTSPVSAVESNSGTLGWNDGYSREANGTVTAHAAVNAADMVIQSGTR